MLPVSCFAILSGSYESYPAVCNMSFTGWVIGGFFVALAVVILVFHYAGKRKLQAPVKEAISDETSDKVQPEQGPEREVYAAIALTLHLYSNVQHDLENPVITMIRTSKTYSPWSSKIYSLRKLPR